MRTYRVFARLVGLVRGVVEQVHFDEDEKVFVVHARPRSREKGRCGICARRSPGYDQGEGRRRWRALDLGTVRAFIEADSPRVACPVHGVVVAKVPWARHGSWFTRDFEDQAAWLATQQSTTAVTRLLRIGWRTVGGIVTRVAAEMRERIADPLDGLCRIGIDEISYRRGQRYIIGVVCHDTGRLVWAADGRSSQVLGRFFIELGPTRCRKIALVSADAGSWVHKAVRAHCPTAMICMDPFHLVRLASDALDEVRRDVWNQARRVGEVDTARFLKGARFALWKAPERLTDRQRTKLARIEELNYPLYRAYLLKEQLRLVFHENDPDTAIALLDEWIVSAQESELAPFIQKAATIRELRAPIVATLRQRLSNARMEQLNTSIRLITRRAFGFKSAEALIALAMLALGGLCPPLPGRQAV